MMQYEFGIYYNSICLTGRAPIRLVGIALTSAVHSIKPFIAWEEQSLLLSMNSLDSLSGYDLLMGEFGMVMKWITVVSFDAAHFFDSRYVRCTVDKMSM